jgi:hypothetical protein
MARDVDDLAEVGEQGERVVGPKEIWVTETHADWWPHPGSPSESPIANAVITSS